MAVSVRTMARTCVLRSVSSEKEGKGKERKASHLLAEDELNPLLVVVKQPLVEGARVIGIVLEHRAHGFQVLPVVGVRSLFSRVEAVDELRVLLSERALGVGGLRERVRHEGEVALQVVLHHRFEVVLRVNVLALVLLLFDEGVRGRQRAASGAEAADGLSLLGHERPHALGERRDLLRKNPARLDVFVRVAAEVGVVGAAEDGRGVVLDELGGVCDPVRDGVFVVQVAEEAEGEVQRAGDEVVLLAGDEIPVPSLRDVHPDLLSALGRDVEHVPDVPGLRELGLHEGGVHVGVGHELEQGRQDAVVLHVAGLQSPDFIRDAIERREALALRTGGTVAVLGAHGQQLERLGVVPAGGGGGGGGGGYLGCARVGGRV
jgi:hypothetical protein